MVVSRVKCCIEFKTKSSTACGANLDVSYNNRWASQVVRIKCLTDVISIHKGGTYYSSERNGLNVFKYGS